MFPLEARLYTLVRLPCAVRVRRRPTAIMCMCIIPDITGTRATCIVTMYPVPGPHRMRTVCRSTAIRCATIPATRDRADVDLLYQHRQHGGVFLHLFRQPDEINRDAGLQIGNQPDIGACE